MVSQIGQSLTFVVKPGLHQTKVPCLLSCGESQLHWAHVRNCLINEDHLAMNLFNSLLTQKND